MREDPKIRALLDRRLDRRLFLRLSAATGGSAAISAILAACGLGGSSSPSGSGSSALATGRTIKLGYVSPTTGSLAPFGEADEFIFDGVRSAIGAGLQIGDTVHPIEIVAKDSQSDANRASTVATELILDDEVDLVLVASTPETTNPVADVCEANGMPCISTVAPWQPYFFLRQGDPANPVPFDWTYHFFWGLEDIIAVFLDMWSKVNTNKVIGAIWPNDGDGLAWSDAANGFPPAFADAGYTLVDPGRYENGTGDFSAQISRFKKEGVEIVTGVPIPPDFTTFWTQAAQQDFHPQVASIGKAMLFPSSAEALGDLATGISTEIWWSPSHPFSSSLTDQSAKALADAYTAATQRQWTQPLGFAHALFEVALDALSRTTDVDSKESIRDAIVATELDTIVGKVQWTGQPFANIAKTPLVGGQWVPGSDVAYDLAIVTNTLAPEVPTSAEMQPIGV
jgi:branched-chain amino acid transport system substrate-binding protein